MKHHLLIVMIAGTALRAAGQVSSPDFAHPFAADLLLGGSTIRGGGTWRSADLVLTHTAPHTVGYVFLRFRKEGTLAIPVSALTRFGDVYDAAFIAALGPLVRAGMRGDR